MMLSTLKHYARDFTFTNISVQRSGATYPMHETENYTGGNDAGGRVDDDGSDRSVMSSSCRRHDITSDATDDAEVAGR